MNKNILNVLHTCIACLLIPGLALAQHDTGVPQIKSLHPDKAYSPYEQRSFPSQAYRGETQGHTGHSLDAGLFGNTTELETAYRLARNEKFVPFTSQPLKMYSVAMTQDDDQEEVYIGPMTKAAAQTADEADAEAAAIAEAMLNPLSYLWLLFTQNDMKWYDGTAMEALGEGSQLMNTTLLMPVLSQQLTEDWKMIFRPVIPINSFKTIDNVNVSVTNPGGITGVELGRKTGLGDIVLWTAFSKQYTPPNIFGFGFTAMLDTASDDFLGTGKNSVGPMALAFKISDKWVNGIVAQH